MNGRGGGDRRGGHGRGGHSTLTITGGRNVRTPFANFMGRDGEGGLFLVYCSQYIRCIASGASCVLLLLPDLGSSMLPPVLD